VAVVIVAAAAAATKAAAAVATGVDPRHNFIRQFFLKKPRSSPGVVFCVQPLRREFAPLMRRSNSRMRNSEKKEGDEPFDA
jgi:hypothetical protein